MTPNLKDLSEQDAVVSLMREHVRVDVSALRPAVVSRFIFSFEGAARAILSYLASRNGGETDAATPPPASADQWRDIASAPKDGTHFLPREDTGDTYRAAFHRDGYFMSFCGQPVVCSPTPTHWMPLPQGPSVDRDGLARDRSEPADLKGGEL